MPSSIKARTEEEKKCTSVGNEVPKKRGAGKSHKLFNCWDAKTVLGRECSKNVLKVCIILGRKRINSFVNNLCFQRLFGFLIYLKHLLLHELA